MLGVWQFGSGFMAGWVAFFFFFLIYLSYHKYGKIPNPLVFGLWSLNLRSLTAAQPRPRVRL